MSLINQMLNDLESRQARLDESPNSVLDGLEFSDVYEYREDHSRPRLLFIILLIMLVSLTVYALSSLSGINGLTVDRAWTLFSEFSGPESAPVTDDFNSHISPLEPGDIEQHAAVNEGFIQHPTETSGEEKDSVSIPTAGVDTGLPMLTLDQVLRTAAANEQSAPPAPANDPAIMDIQVVQSDEGASIDLQFASEPEYSLFTLEDPSRLVLELDNYRSDDSIPMRNLLPDTIKLRTRHENDMYQVVFEFDRPMQLQDTWALEQGSGMSLHIELLHNDGHEARRIIAVEPPERVENTANAVDSVNSTTETVVVNRTAIDKKVLREDTVRQSTDLHDQGMAAYRHGDIIQAIDTLYTAVSSDANNHSARVDLVEILLDQGDTAAARKLLINGLERKPDHTHMARLLAEILAVENNNGMALFYLERALPDIRKDPEYHALVAALLQREERHREAILFYRNVLNLNADNGLWWMGLGISLEATGSGQMALSAYRRARQDSTLSAGVARYLDSRISQLYKQQPS
jgi:Flp pilus assembly protein TadD